MSKTKSLGSYDHTRKNELEVIKLLRETEYTLNSVNYYGENLLHISAANGCVEITKEILNKIEGSHVINRKDKFGWTPLMQAIRNGNMSTVKLLLEKHANVNESTYLGMSILGLAAAVSKEMFETVHAACPFALTNAANDDITPLCIAAMKNDKALFFRLLELGLEISKANEYTHIMMRQSIIPEIALLAKSHFDVDDYWNDTSDNIEVQDELYKVKSKEGDTMEYILRVTQVVQNNRKDQDKCNNNNSISITSVDSKAFVGIHSPSKIYDKSYSASCSKISELSLLPVEKELDQQSLISPTLTYNYDGEFPVSPNIYLVQTDKISQSNMCLKNKTNSQLLSDSPDVSLLRSEHYTHRGRP